ncbi:MAG: Glu/Leu/Phe/Val dehydrogenase [Chlorobi bacterium]|nr:Glu/Leu/Phe/Val dehydrogenase [Chlorobiota bacterium]
MTALKTLLNYSPEKFISFLENEGIFKFYFAYDDKKKKLIASHEILQPLADYFSKDKRDFLEHEGMFFQVSASYPVILGAFVHSAYRGQAAGGVRFWQYDSIENYFRDGLRLSKGMTRKNALAGLWWGGGKGVMTLPESIDKTNLDFRAAVYREYGEFISSINGCYVTAEDVGTSVDDMANVFSGTRFTTCIPPYLGGSGNPSVPTARGVVAGMEAALESLKMETLEGKTIAVQGMGHVAEPLIGFLFEKKAKEIIAVDIFPETVEAVKKKFAGLRLKASAVKPGDFSILKTKCDILAPCATGAVLNPKTIPSIKAKIICGAANNQLADSERDDKALFKKGILYVPDFLTNRMGIVNCANEQYGYLNNDPLIENHLSKDWEHSIHQTAMRVFKESKRKKEPTGKIAIAQADKLSLVPHPIFGRRGKEIIKSLVENKWHE